ncbi:MAG TPA: SprB repeat-containing protein, partial [Bacteroidia bacterium]|nr:SprB repeat-containing protein [Bacteroidia bacterium]
MNRLPGIYTRALPAFTFWQKRLLLPVILLSFWLIPYLSFASPFTLSATTSNYNGYAVSCFDSANGSIDLTVTGGTVPFTFLWSSGQTTEDINSLTAGVYIVTVVDADLDTMRDTVQIIQPGVIDILFSSVSDVLCNGGLTGAIDITLSGGTGIFSYTWSNGATTEDVSGLAAGPYTISITDNNNCPAQNDTTIGEPPPLFAGISHTDANAAPDGTAMSTPTGGAGSYSYLWSTTATTAGITGLLPGTYTVTVTDANNCTVVDQAVVANALGPCTIISDSTINVTCNGAANGGVYISLSAAIAPITYNWSNGATTEDITALGPGTYTITITDVINCVAVDSFIVTEPTALNDSVQSVNPTCGLFNGSITDYPYAGTSPYTYQWNTGQTTQTISSLAAGTYTVTIRDANLCSRTRTRTITNQSGPNVALDSVRAVACNGGLTGGVYITP